MVAALNPAKEVFVVDEAYLRAKMIIYPTCKIQIALLVFEKVIILAKYLDFTDIFLEKSVREFLKWTKINKHIINLELVKQLSYSPIYSLESVDLEILKIHIETNLANGFIWLFKSSVGALIFYVQKPNGNFCLCVDYQDLNNLTIKN